MKISKVASSRAAIDDFVKKFKNDVLKQFYSSSVKRDMAEYVMIELLDNAFEHGNKKDAAKSIWVESDIKGDKLIASIEDEGEGFSPEIPDKCPSLQALNGRGLWSVRDIASSMDFNEKGNKVTVTFFKMEENMGNTDDLFSIFNGHLVIIRPPEGAGIEAMSEKIVDFSTSKSAENENADFYLLLDLSLYSAVNSAFFGTLGATIQIPYVKQVALCGMKSSVQKIAQRFGIVDRGVFKNGPTKEINDNGQKFRIFDSLEKATLELVPESN